MVREELVSLNVILNPEILPIVNESLFATTISFLDI